MSRTSQERIPLLGIRVQDDRKYSHVDPALGLHVINEDADCRYNISPRQMYFLLEALRLLETPQPSPVFDGLSYLRGLIEGMKNGESPLLVAYQTPHSEEAQCRARQSSRCLGPDGLSGAPA